MSAEDLSFSSEFPPHDEARWRAGVEKALKGRPAETLDRKTIDGLTIRALSRETDFSVSADPYGAPGSAPFIRGAQAEPDPHLPWDIRQVFTHPDAARTNAEILRDLMRGVSSLELVVDPTGLDLNQRLADVRADIATVSIRARGGFRSALEVTSTLADWAKTQDAGTARLGFNLDPIGDLLRTGISERGIDADFVDCARMVQHLSATFPHSRSLTIDGTLAHEAGSGRVIELATLTASLVDTLRRLEAAGLNRSDAVAQIVIRVAVDADHMKGIAKLRAVRLLVAQVLDTLDLPPRAVPVHAVTSARMMTRRDPWVNMLRVTTAVFAAGAGGADIVTSRPFTEPLGLPDELARRVARNTQIIAQAESHIGRVADPAGGAWSVEAHARDLGEVAWSAFQEIETEGGLVNAALSGSLQQRIASDRKALRERIATRKQPLTGTSSYPLLDEIIPETEAFPTVPTGDISAADPVTECDPLWPIRLAEPFEHLRDRADAVARRLGRAPAIRLVALGSEAASAARVDFARHLFASGGLALDADAQAGSSPVAVICGTDEAYAEQAEATARSLAKNGFARIVLAARPGENEANCRAAGVTDFIFMGCNAIEALERVHAELGLMS